MLRGWGSRSSHLDTEETKAKRLIGEGAGALWVAAWLKNFQGLGGAAFFGLALGMALSWFIWTRVTLLTG